MTHDKKLSPSQRMAKNIEYFSHRVKNEPDKIAIQIMIDDFSQILNDTIKAKFIQSFEKDNSMAQLAFSQTSNFNAKIETCYTLKAFGEDVRAILHQFDLLKEDFHGFNDFNSRCYIKEILRLSKSELLTLILSLIHEKKLPNIRCSTMSELLDSLGYQGVVKFIFAVLAAALMENLLLL